MELPDEAGVLPRLSLLAAGSLPQDPATVKGAADTGVRDDRAEESPAVVGRALPQAADQQMGRGLLGRRWIGVSLTLYTIEGSCMYKY